MMTTMTTRPPLPLLRHCSTHVYIRYILHRKNDILSVDDDSIVIIRMMLMIPIRERLVLNCQNYYYNYLREGSKIKQSHTCIDI